MKRNYTVKDNKIISDESRVHYQVVQYIRLAYPKVLLHTDAAGELMTDAIRIRQSRLNIPGFKMPDIQIMEARKGYYGLFIELKKVETLLYKKSGLFVNDHVERQARSLEMLSERGYLAVFAKGFLGAREIVDKYLKP